MDNQALETIGLELAILHRRLTSITTHKTIGNLERSEYLLLGQIASHGTAGVRALADEFHLDISTVSRQVAALEKKDYVYRIPDPVDKRAYFLQITEQGLQEFEEAKKLRNKKMAELLVNWSDEERELFADLLRKFNRTFLQE